MRSKMRGIGFTFVVLATYAGGPTSLWGASNENLIPKVVAVQKRGYVLSDEAALQASYLPMDSFNSYFTVGATYTHYFNDYLGWEIINANYANSYSSGLTDYLRTKFGLATNQFDIVNYYATTNIVYTPLYMKNLLFNTSIVYGEISFVAGLGLTKFNINNYVNTVDFGAIFRYYLTRKTSLKFDFREYLYLAGDSKDNLALTGGVAYNFGSGGEEEEKVVAPTPEVDE